MILGHVLDLAPRVKLTLNGLSSPVAVEFIIDTGFEGEIALPETVVNRLATSYLGPRAILMADGSESEGIEYIATVDWNGAPRQVQILALRSGNPLLGVELLADNLVTLEMTDGGEITIEPL